jgi:anti-anti-sigma factor
MKIETSKKGKFLVLSLLNVPKGQLDLTNIKMLKTRIEAVIPQEEQHVLLDMEKITYVDSSVIGYLVDLLNRFRGRTGSFGLIAINPKIQNILELANLTKFFVIFPSLDAVEG